MAEGHGENTPTSKDTNPKDAVAVAHLKWSAIPFRVLVGVALALSEGAWKYARHNYRVAGVKSSVYFDAALDHLLAWWEGEDIDQASGEHHLDKLLACVMVLRDAQLAGMSSDDRPPAVKPGWIEEGHARTAALFARMHAAYGASKPPFTRTPDLASMFPTIDGVTPEWSAIDIKIEAIECNEDCQACTTDDTPPATPEERAEFVDALEPRPRSVPEGVKWAWLDIGARDRVPMYWDPDWEFHGNEGGVRFPESPSHYPADKGDSPASYIIVVDLLALGDEELAKRIYRDVRVFANACGADWPIDEYPALFALDGAPVADD